MKKPRKQVVTHKTTSTRKLIKRKKSVQTKRSVGIINYKFLITQCLNWNLISTFFEFLYKLSLIFRIECSYVFFSVTIRVSWSTKIFRLNIFWKILRRPRKILVYQGYFRVNIFYRILGRLSQKWPRFSSKSEFV